MNDGDGSSTIASTTNNYRNNVIIQINNQKNKNKNNNNNPNPNSNHNNNSNNKNNTTAITPK